MAATINIAGQSYDFFNKISIDLKYGSSASVFNFSALFDPENPTHRRIFRPLSYQPVTITSDLRERLLTGVIIRHKFSRAANRVLSNFQGYSSTGVLSDSAIDIGNYPLEYSNLTFREIAEKLIAPYNITLTVDPSVTGADDVIEEITAENNTTIYSFLNNIAAQRNLVLTHNALGNLLLTRPNTSESPVATFRQSIPATRMSLDVNGQGIHSDITVLKQADIINDNASELTINNTLINSFRPIVKQQNVGNDVTVEEAARNVRANELRSIRLSIETDRWQWLRNQTRETMTPNNIISVISPDNYIFNRTSFFVESVKLNADNEKETATLSCVLPEVYNNNEPQNIFS